MIVTDSLAGSSLIDTLALRRASYNGFNVAIATLSQIDAAPDTIDTPVAIRAMIDSVYSSQTAGHMSDGHLGYVLLVGDAFDSERNVLVPSYYGYGSAQNQQAASDAYYSFLDDDPGTDLLPDVLIGRLPVDDDAEDWELENIVGKVLAYEPLPAAAWVDSVLMVSGVNDGGFTFDGLSGFQAFFDSVLAHYSPAGKSVTQLHRLTLSPGEGNHGTFGETVASRVEAGKWMTAFFDHGNLYGWDGAFYPRNYEFLDNEEEPTIVLSLGSHTSQFDNTQETGQAWYGACCTVPPPAGIGCESPGHEYIDPCDALAERLLVQPGGAIGVIGYSRTTGTWNAQQDLVSLFRSLSQQNPGTLGELLVGARLFRLSDPVTVRNLMLLGDPALNLRTQAPAAPDTFDVAVGTLDIRSPWSTYIRKSGSPVEVNVHNIWKTDVYNLEVELWHGEPGGGESTLLGAEALDTLRAYGAEPVLFSVSGLEGNVRLYAVLDPDDLIAERAEDNNVAFRDFLALSYEGDYPARVSFSPRQCVTIADLTTTPGKEFLVAGIGTSNYQLKCYELGDTNAAWTYSTSSSTAYIKNQPPVGHMYKSASSYVAVEWGNPSSLRVLSGQSGSVVKTRAVGDTRFSASSWEARCLLTDLGADDPLMELLVLKHVDAGNIDSLYVRAFAPNGSALFTRLVEVANNAQPTAFAVGDLDRNGSKEILTLQMSASNEPPAFGRELTVLSYGAGGLARKWQADAATDGAIAAPSIVLIDTDSDGDLSILCNGASFGQVLRLYDSDSTLVWSKSDFSVTTAYPAIHFSAGDVDGDGNAEVVVADHGRVRILSSSDGSVLHTQAMEGDPIAPPLLADLNANGELDVVVVFEQQDPNIHFYPPTAAPYWTHLSVLDSSLDLVHPAWTFRTLLSGTGSCLPAIEDIDGDGKFEMVYVSPDQYLHVFEIGTAAGDVAWSQRFANALNSGLNEQPLLGDAYTNPVSLYQRTRMLGHVSLDSIAAPSLYVGYGTEVRVDTSVVDPFQLRAFGSVRMKGSTAAPVVFRSEPPSSGAATWGGLHVDDRFASGGDPDTLLGLTITDAGSAISGRSQLFIKDVTIPAAFDNGVDLFDAGAVVLDGLLIGAAYNGIDVGDGTAVILTNSNIEDCEQHGVDVYGESRFEAKDTFFDGCQVAVVLDTWANSWVSAIIRDCTFTNNADGIWVSETVDSTVVVKDCTIEDISGTGIYALAANLVIDGTTIRGGEIGVNASMRTALELSSATIEDASLFGVTVSDSWLEATGTSFDGNDIGLNLVTIQCVEPDPPCADSWIKAIVRGCEFTNNGDGVWVEILYDSSVVVDDCFLDDNVTSGIYVEGSGDVLITRNEITNNTIGIYSYESNPSIRSKNVIQYNAGGIKCDNFSTAVVESCTVNNNANAFAIINDANPDLGHSTGGNSMGYNIIRPNTAYHVSNLTSNTIMAENNYWPKSPPITDCNPPSTKFYGSVDRTPHLECDEPNLSLHYQAPLLSGGEAEPGLPKQFRLGQNFPNPFNPTTTIMYEVPKPGSSVELVLYDVTGKRVAVLVEEYKAPGFYSQSWDGRNRNGEPLASGVYFLRMRAGAFVGTKKLLLLK